MNDLSLHTCICVQFSYNLPYDKLIDSILELSLYRVKYYVKLNHVFCNRKFHESTLSDDCLTELVTLLWIKTSLSQA